MLECFSRILGRKPWPQCLGARCRRTRICSVFPCRTVWCRECWNLPWGSVLRCQHCARRRGPVESSTYDLLLSSPKLDRDTGPAEANGRKKRAELGGKLFVSHKLLRNQDCQNACSKLSANPLDRINQANVLRCQF